MNPKVIDISHYDSVVGDGFKAVKAFGIVGVVHKASEGQTITDRPYAARRVDAVAAGLLWGAYHFIRPGNTAAQVDLFLRTAQPDDDTLLSIDWEVANVSNDQAREFIEGVEAKTGRGVVVYSYSSMLKEKFGTRRDPWFGSRRLWLAQYSSHVDVQPSWARYWLWQYTGDGSGPGPHQVPGIQIDGGLDISSWDGTDDELRAQWSGVVSHLPPIPVEPPAPVVEPPAPVVEPPVRPVLFHAVGKCSWFGGPKDDGVGPEEGLALYGNNAQLLADTRGADWVLSQAQAGASGLARRINPDKPYIACRWPPSLYPYLRRNPVRVEANGIVADDVYAADWGPNPNTNRVADLSPGLLKRLGLDTDDRVAVTVYGDGK